MNILSKLTDYEVDALPNLFNFADGHARNALNIHLLEQIKQIPTYFSKKFDQGEIEREFCEMFFRLSRQNYKFTTFLFCPSASISIEIIANYLRINGISTSLIEPTFDNLADIFKRHLVKVDPLEERLLFKIPLMDWLATVNTEAIFLTIPNNPTGYIFSQDDFKSIIEFCAANQKLLILDMSFRLFDRELMVWDQYDMLAQSGIHYIVIEDTGKVWPSYELKVSLLASDEETSQQLQSIYRDIFICHSPVIIQIVLLFIKDSLQQGLDNTVWNLVEANRNLLRNALTGTFLKPVTISNISVEWVQICNGLTDIQLVNELKARNIFILPGRNFFWNTPSIGSNYIRVALMRQREIFSLGAIALRSLLLSLRA